MVTHPPYTKSYEARGAVTLDVFRKCSVSISKCPSLQYSYVCNWSFGLKNCRSESSAPWSSNCFPDNKLFNYSLKESGSSDLFIHILYEVWLSGFRAAITIINIRQFHKMCHNIVRFRFFLEELKGLLDHHGKDGVGGGGGAIDQDALRSIMQSKMILQKFQSHFQGYLLLLIGG